MGAAVSLRDAPDRAAVRPVEALARLLDGLAAVVIGIPADVYVARPVPDVSGSIGAQVRHALDHIAAFVAASSTSPLSYDHRERGTSVESDPASALRTIFRLKTALVECSTDCLGAPLEVIAKVSPTGESVRAWSSRGRELAFVQSHTIHHQAIIAMLLVIQGYAPPAGFGYAPSTPRS
jgi:hypothetical protein